MMKGFVYAVVAAMVSFAAVTWASRMVSDQPSAAFAGTGRNAAANDGQLASLTQELADQGRMIAEQKQQITTLVSALKDDDVAPTEAMDMAALTQERTEQDRVIAAQRERIRSLETELKNMPTALADTAEPAERARKRAEQENIIATQRKQIAALEAELKDARSAPADTADASAPAGKSGTMATVDEKVWQEIQRLEGAAATYREQLEAAERRRRIEVSRLQAEIDLRDQNIASISRALTVDQANARRERTANEASSAQPKQDAATPTKPDAPTKAVASTKDAAPMKVATPAKPDTALNTTAARKDATPMTTAALAKVPGPAMTPPSPGTNTPAEAKTDAKTAAPATSAAAASKAATGDAGPLSGVFSLTLNDGVRAYEARNFAAAYDIWLQLAEQGDARAQFHLGALYFEGRGVARDFGKAREWLGRASKSGDGRAAMMLKRVNAAAAASAGT